MHDLTQTFPYNPAGHIQSIARSNDAYVADDPNRIMSAGACAFSDARLAIQGPAVSRPRIRSRRVARTR